MPAGLGAGVTKFPEVASASPQLRRQVEQKWAREIAAAAGRR
jgi:hypothetical protein